jgi:hypothetical protein
VYRTFKTYRREKARNYLKEEVKRTRVEEVNTRSAYSKKIKKSASKIKSLKKEDIESNATIQDSGLIKDNRKLIQNKLDTKIQELIKTPQPNTTQTSVKQTIKEEGNEEIKEVRSAMDNYQKVMNQRNLITNHKSPENEHIEPLTKRKYTMFTDIEYQRSSSIDTSEVGSRLNDGREYQSLIERLQASSCNEQLRVQLEEFKESISKRVELLEEYYKKTCIE